MTISKPSTIVAMARKIRAYYKAKYLKREAEAYFDAQVHHCCRVSANNPFFSCLIHHVGPFGGPQVELIDRPKNVGISEYDDFVVIKDGKVYELTRTER